MVFIESSCFYCGCSCRLNYEVKDNKIIKVLGVKGDEVSDGAPCIKGLTINEVFDQNRITKPTINGKPVTLAKAFDHIIKNTKSLAPSEVFFNTSGKLTNEDNYVLEEFARDCFGTANIDSCCGRLCHNATVMAMNNVFGTPNITLMSNVDKIDTLLIIGSEPEKNYPVFYNKLLRKKLKVIRVHSFMNGHRDRETMITIRPGSETCLLNGLIRELIRKGVTSNHQGFRYLREKVRDYKPEYVIKNCNISKKDYYKLLKTLVKSKSLGIFHGMGLTQYVNSLENVHSLLNLALLKKAKILTLRGEVNVQGVGDVYGSACKSELKCKGLNIIEALMLSPAKALFITEFDPLKSMPAITELTTKFKKAFTVYFGSYHNNTSKSSNVVIPIASLLESEGTITNGERRVRKITKVIEGPDQLWKVLKKLAERMKKKLSYHNTKEILIEIKKKVIDYSKININELWLGNDQWPDKSVKKYQFMPEDFDGIADLTSDKYPFILTTYRSRYSFLSNEITKNSKTLSKMREPPGFYMNPEDLKNLGLKEGQPVKVSSTVTSLNGKVYASKKLPSGIIGAYFHYSSLPINKLFPLKFDEESFTPNYKSVAVSLKTL